MRKWLNKYFDFTKSEFNGLLVLVFLIIAVTAAPYAYAQFVKEEYRPEDYLMVKRLILKDEEAESQRKFPGKAQVETEGKSHAESQQEPEGENQAKYEDKISQSTYTYPRDASSATPGTSSAAHRVDLFPFDPNVTSKKDWVRLGLSERQAAAILKYIQKGGQFRQATDLKKMYTISPEKYLALYPYVRIPQAPVGSHSSLARSHSSIAGSSSSLPGSSSSLSSSNSSIASSNSSWNDNAISKASAVRAKNSLGYVEKTAATQFKKPLVLIEINAADSVGLDEIRGIGPAFASRILKYRARLGGFVEKSQLMEVFGLDSVKYLEIRDQIRVDASAIKMININTVTADNLRNHPYLRYKQVNALLQYRKQHGNYSNIADLAKVVLIPAETIAQLAPYLTF